jgi:hypothetical protein
VSLTANYASVSVPLFVNLSFKSPIEGGQMKMKFASGKAANTFFAPYMSISKRGMILF